MSILNQFLNKTAVVCGLVAVSLITLPMAASAGDRGDRRAFKKSSSKVVVKNNRGSRGNKTVVVRNSSRNHNYYDNRRNTRKAYKRGYRQGSHSSSPFLAGLVGGAILHSAFNNNHYGSNVGISYNYGYGNYGYNNYGYNNYGYNNYGYSNYGSSYPSYRYAPRTNVVYVERPVQTVVQQVPVYAQAPAQQQYQYAPTQAAQPAENCLQVREYTTTIEIGGQTVPAYGQACLQPDGSWKFGDPIAEPSF